MLEQITGFLVSTEDAAINMTSDMAGGLASGLPDAVLRTLVVIALVFLGWLVILGITSIILFIISCVKQNIPLSELLNKSFSSFKALYRQMFKYYLPLIILSFIVGIYNLISNILQIFETAIPNSSSWAFLIMLLFAPFIIATSIYMGVLDSSLAKSYYNSLKTKKFSFTWITWGEFFRLIWISILYFLMVLASLLLLGIPLLFLPVISLFFRHPILNEGMGAGETIRKLISMLKKDFWNLMFFYGIYGLIVGGVSVVFQIVPVIGYVAVMVIVTPIATLLATEAYYLLNKNYEQGGKKAIKKA